MVVHLIGEARVPSPIRAGLRANVQRAAIGKMIRCHAMKTRSWP